MNISATLPSISILESRNQYRCCHIQVPDLEERVAAIHTGGRYYSFFRVEQDKQRALEMAQRLGNRGEASVITQTPRGFALWVNEPEAQPHAPKKSSARNAVNSTQPVSALTKAGEEFLHCFIRVPDLDKRLAAIYVQDQYYSLFKTVETMSAVMDLLERLSQRGDRAVVTWGSIFGRYHSA
jgi:hypothetical protein